MRKKIQKEKQYRFRLYKNRFNDNWHIEVVESDVWHMYSDPDRRYWTECLETAALAKFDAQRYFGHYVNRGSFQISGAYKGLIFGRKQEEK